MPGRGGRGRFPELLLWIVNVGTVKQGMTSINQEGKGGDKEVLSREKKWNGWTV